MISLHQSVLLFSTETSIDSSLTSMLIVVVLLFSVIGAPRAKYDAEANRRLLLRLLRSRALSQKELIHISNLSKSNVNYAINTLIREGKVAKTKNIGLDMRSVVYHVVMSN